jgi:dihydroneopterin aldolase
LRVHGHHGVLPAEREHGQEFVIDVDLEVDIGRAAATDDLSDTVDYAALSDRVAAVVSGEAVNLIETLASRIAAACLADAHVRAVTVEVHKPHAPVTAAVDDITVRIRREQS